MILQEEVLKNINPGIKFISVITLTITVFFIDKIQINVLFILLLILFRLGIGVTFKANGFTYRNIVFLSLFLILTQGLFGPGDTFIYQIYPGYGFKQEGLLLGFQVVLKIISMLIIFPILTVKLKSQELAAGLTSLGFQYKISFMITTAINYIPRLKEEARLIMDAQKLRGVESKSLRLYTSLCLPLVLSAMKKAQISSVSMDSRAFGVYKDRTYLKKMKINKNDIFYLLFCIAFSALILILSGIVWQL